jgi:hypothetical protein
MPTTNRVGAGVVAGAHSRGGRQVSVQNRAVLLPPVATNGRAAANPEAPRAPSRAVSVMARAWLQLVAM